MSTKRREITFHEWAERTTAHGFSDLVRTRSKIEKFIWLFLILICTLIMCDQLYRGYVQYSKHEWEMSVKEQPKTELRYPNLILCNINRLKYSKTKEYGLTTQMISNMFGIQHAIFNYYGANWTIDVEEFVEWRKSRNLTYLEIFEKMAPTCEDIFMGDVCTNKRYEIEPIDTYEYGRCWKISPPDWDVRRVTGTIGDMVLVLSAQQDEYLPTVQSNHLGVGLALQVSYTGSVHLGQWIILNPGMRTSVGLSVVEKTVRDENRAFWNPLALMDSKPPCDMNPTMPYSKETDYSLASCLTECSFFQVVKHCQCVPFISSKLYRTCEIEEIMNCFIEKQNDTSEQKVNETLAWMNVEREREECEASCGVPCKMSFLETETSTMRIRSDQQEPEFKNLLNSLNVKNIKTEDLIFLDVYFTSISVKVQELYEVMSFDNLISSSGGLMGLWAGMSFLTIFQAICYFFKFLRTCSRKDAFKSFQTETVV